MWKSCTVFHYRMFFIPFQIQIPNCNSKNRKNIFSTGTNKMWYRFKDDCILSFLWFHNTRIYTPIWGFKNEESIQTLRWAKILLIIPSFSRRCGLRKNRKEICDDWWQIRFRFFLFHCSSFFDLLMLRIFFYITKSIFLWFPSLVMMSLYDYYKLYELWRDVVLSVMV